MIKRIITWMYGAARTNDPRTSREAAAVDRSTLSERVLTVIRGGHYEPREAGWTGHELAEILEVPLNSVTPRLAPLRKAGLIKASNHRRNGQIAWIPCEATDVDAY